VYLYFLERVLLLSAYQPFLMNPNSPEDLLLLKTLIEMQALAIVGGFSAQLRQAFLLKGFAEEIIVYVFD
jgi:hypothetical protein